MSTREVSISIKFTQEGIASAKKEIQALSKELQLIGKVFQTNNSGDISAAIKKMNEASKVATSTLEKQKAALKAANRTWEESIELGHQAAATMTAQDAIAKSLGATIQKNLQKTAMKNDYEKESISLQRQLEAQYATEIQNSIRGGKAVFANLKTTEEFNKVKRSTYEIQQRQAQQNINAIAQKAKLLNVTYKEVAATERLSSIMKELKTSDTSNLKFFSANQLEQFEQFDKLMVEQVGHLNVYKEKVKSGAENLYYFQNRLKGATRRMRESGAETNVLYQRYRKLKNAGVDVAMYKFSDATKRATNSQKVLSDKMNTINTGVKAVTGAYTKQTQAQTDSVNAIDKENAALERKNVLLKKTTSRQGHMLSGTTKLLATIAGGIFTLNQFYIWGTRIYRMLKSTYEAVDKLIKQYAEFMNVAKSAAFILQTTTDTIAGAASGVTLLGIKMQDAAKGLDEFGRAGYRAKEAMQAFVPISMFAKAANADLGRATTMVTGTMKALGLEAKDTWKITNSMIYAIYKSRNSFESLETAMAYAASAGGAFNQVLSEQLSTVSTLRDLGLQESTAGTAYRRSIVKFSYMSKSIQDQFTAMGLSAEEFTVTSERSFNTVLEKLARVNKLMPEKAFDKLILDITGTRFGAYINNVVNKISEGKVSLSGFSKKMREDSKLLESVYKFGITKISNQMDTLSAVWDKAWKLMGGAAAGYINEATAAFNYIANNVLEEFLVKFKLITSEVEEMSSQRRINMFDAFNKTANDNMTQIYLTVLSLAQAFKEYGGILDWAYYTTKSFILIVAGIGIAAAASAQGLMFLGTRGAEIATRLWSGWKIYHQKFQAGLKARTEEFKVFLNEQLKSVLLLKQKFDQLNLFDSLFSAKRIKTAMSDGLIFMAESLDNFFNYIRRARNNLKIFGQDTEVVDSAGLVKAIVEFDKVDEMLGKRQLIRNLEAQKSFEASYKKFKFKSKTSERIRQEYDAAMKMLNKKQKELEEAEEDTAASDKAVANILKLETALKTLKESWDDMIANPAPVSNKVEFVMEKILQKVRAAKDKFVKEGGFSGLFEGLYDPDKIKMDNMKMDTDNFYNSMHDKITFGKQGEGSDEKEQIKAKKLLAKQRLEVDKFYSTESNLIKANDYAKEEFLNGKSALSFVNAYNTRLFTMKDNHEITMKTLEERLTTEAKFREELALTNEQEIQHLEQLAEASTEFSEIFSYSFMAAGRALGTFQSMTSELASSMVSTMESGMTNMFMSVFDKSKKIKDVFKDMGKAMLRSLMSYLSKMILQTLIMGKLMATVHKKQNDGELLMTTKGAEAAAYRRGWEAAPGFGGLFLANLFLGMAKTQNKEFGVKAFNQGTGLDGVPGIGNTDSVAAMLTPGEIVLNNAESDEYRQTRGQTAAQPIIINIHANDYESFASRSKQALTAMLEGDAEVRTAMGKSLRKQGA